MRGFDKTKHLLCQNRVQGLCGVSGLSVNTGSWDLFPLIVGVRPAQWVAYVHQGTMTSKVSLCVAKIIQTAKNKQTPEP